MKKTIVLILSVLLTGTIAMGMNDGEKDRGESNTIANNLDMEKICNEVNAAFLNSSEINIIYADNYGLDNTIPKDTRDAILSELIYPEFARENAQQGIVMVSFTYDEDGYINILSTNYSDENLNKYIIDKLEKIRLGNGIVTPGNEYLLKFHFELL